MNPIYTTFFMPMYHWHDAWYRFFGVYFSGPNHIPDVWTRPHTYQVANWADGLVYLLISGSGFLMWVPPWYDYYIGTIDDLFFPWAWIVLGAMLLAIFLDYVTLTNISDFNKYRKVKKSNNKLFSRIFVLWRVFLLDVFVVSSATALATGMTLSKKEIIRLVFVAQLLRTIPIIFVFTSIYFLNPA